MRVLAPFWTLHEPGRDYPWRLGTERPPMTLLKVAGADIRERKLLDVEYEGIQVGTANAGKGPSATEKQRIAYHSDIEAAKKLDAEMLTVGRTIQGESSHRPPSAITKSNRKVVDSQRRNKHAGC